MTKRIVMALALAFAVVNLIETGAGAHNGSVKRKLGGLCGTPPCFSAFTVNGGAPPTGVGLSLTVAGANIQVSVTKTGSNELSPSIGTNDTLHMVLDLGTYDPVVFGTTGVVSSFSESLGADNTITLDVKPSASSWNPGSCSLVSCGSDVSPVTASTDFTSVMLGFVSDLSTSGASQATKDAMRGSWFSTNAQAMALPTFNATTHKVSFTVAAPHFKTDGTTLNQGFFKFFAPDALVQSMGIADPTTVSSGSFAITSSNNVSTTFSVSHQTGPDGVLIDAPSYSYSSPTFTVAKSATVPGAPTAVSAVPGSGQATVSFTAPASDGGAAITSYTATASPGGATASGSGSPITVTGLTNGTAYTFTVTASNSAGAGPASTASSAVTPKAVPGAPTSVSAVPGDGQATVSFTAPASDGGAAITSYTATASPGGASASGSGSPITVTGLTNGTAYTFTVTASNSAGAGPASTASDAATPAAAASPAPEPPPPPPPTVTVSQSGHTTEATVPAGLDGALTLAAPQDGMTAPTVAWGATTFGNADVAVTAVTAAVTSDSTPAALNGFVAGSLAVELTVTSDGSEIHSFAEPIEVVFPDAAPSLAPAYSNDGGATWVAIPQLNGTTLPAGQADGWYRDAQGAAHLLARHATYFGLIGPLVLKTGNRPAFPVGSRAIFVFLAPERAANATVVLETRHGKVLRRLTASLPAGTTRLRIPLPRGLKAGLYLVKVAAAGGPARANATLLVRLGR